jgi:hypothetical protein
MAKNSLKKISIFFALVLLVLIIGAVLWLRDLTGGSHRGSALSKEELDNIVTLGRASFGFPKMVTDYAQAEGIEINADNQLEIYLTLVNINNSTPNVDEELDKVKKVMVADSCENRQIHFLLYKGIVVLLKFKSKDNVELFQQLLVPEDCGLDLADEAGTSGK